MIRIHPGFKVIQHMAKYRGSAASGYSVEGSALELQQRRQRAGISLEQIAERTKISIRFLKAIESEEFEKLPGGIFATSYLRQYAAVVGIDEAALLERYRTRWAPRSEVVEEPVRESVRNPIVRILRASLTVVR
jgi:cytoskeletal protein RodZ